MKKGNKFLSNILAILMVISIIPLTASAETSTSGVCGKNATWEFDETTSTLTISGEGAMYDFYYHFYSSKETVDTRPWASYDDLIEFVVIDDGITHIGEYAFLDFDLLTIITIPDSVTSIGEYAFEEAEPLVVHYKGTETQWNNVTIGGANTGLYYERTRFYFVDFPVSDSGTWHENITWSFDADTSTLTISGTGIMNADFGDLYRPNKKQFRGNRGWDYYKYHIEQVVITDGVTQIGGDVFRYHPNLKKVIIPKSIHTIDIGALDSGKSLSDIYYSGTEEDWNNINIRECSLLGKPNSSYKPNNATIHFLGEEVHECSYNAVVTAPTCKEQGYTTYTCECGDSYVDDYVDAIGHNHASEITTPATHTTTGIMTYTCACGDSYTEVIAKLEKHNYESVVTAPTCTEQGYTTYTCECSDSYVADYVNALGHTEEIIPAVVPTCTETGLTDGTKCSICDDILTEQTTVNALGHTPATEVEENYVAPTCTEDGSKDVVVYCSVCEEEISRDTVVINATGHSYTAVVTPPTCTEQGYTTYTCDCGETYVDDYVNATGHADNDGDGYCDADNEFLDPSVECEHMCHTDGIMGIIWRIINVFNMLFGLNKTCECGVLHY